MQQPNTRSAAHILFSYGKGDIFQSFPDIRLTHDKGYKRRFKSEYGSPSAFVYSKAHVLHLFIIAEKYGIVFMLICKLLYEPLMFKILLIFIIKLFFKSLIYDPELHRLALELFAVYHVDILMQYRAGGYYIIQYISLLIIYLKYLKAFIIADHITVKQRR